MKIQCRVPVIKCGRNFVKTAIVILLALVPILFNSTAKAQIKEHTMQPFVNAGDINIAVIESIHTGGDSGVCNTKMSRSGFSKTEAVRYIVNQINHDPSILPNIRLGFIVMDSCQDERITLRHINSHIQPLWRINKSDSFESRVPVFGLVCCQRSETSIVASFLSQSLPLSMISPSSTFSQLYNRQRHRYFFGLSSNAQLTGEVLVKLLLELGWTYFFLVYQSTQASFDMAHGVERSIKRHSICLAMKEVISDEDLSSQYARQIIEKMINKVNEASVVVLLLDQANSDIFYGQYEKLLMEGNTRQFTFVYGDNFSPFSRKYQASLNHSIQINNFEMNGRSNDYLKNLTYNSAIDNPWMKEMMTIQFKCSWEPRKLERFCLDYTNISFGESTLHGGRNFVKSSILSEIETAIIIYANALHSLLSRECGGVFISSQPLGECHITNRAILNALSSGVFQSNSKYGTPNVKFNSNGQNLMARLNIHQFIYTADGDLHKYKIGSFDVLQENFNLNRSLFMWENDTVPISVCALPCRANQLTIRQGAKACCWKCYSCPPNYIVTTTPNDNNTIHCTPCPRFTWPDSVNFSQCHKITPTDLADMPMIVCLNSIFCGFGLLLTFSCMFVFLLLRHDKIIRATGLPTMMLILFWIFIIFVHTTLYSWSLSPTICRLRIVIFCIAHSALYATLFAKTLRIVLIFVASNHYKEPKFVRNKHQAILISCLIIFEVKNNEIVFIPLWNFQNTVSI